MQCENDNGAKVYKTVNYLRLELFLRQSKQAVLKLLGPQLIQKSAKSPNLWWSSYQHV